MTNLGEWITEEIEKQIWKNKLAFLKKQDTNTFDALMYECLEINEGGSGATYNGVYYDEWLIYAAYWHFYPDGDPWF